MSFNCTVRTANAVVQGLRRASGVADVLPGEPTEDIPALEQPSHAVRDSMLHSNSGFNNYRGLYNLALIALVRRWVGGFCGSR